MKQVLVSQSKDYFLNYGVGAVITCDSFTRSIFARLTGENMRNVEFMLFDSHPHSSKEQYAYIYVTEHPDALEKYLKKLKCTAPLAVNIMYPMMDLVQRNIYVTGTDTAFKQHPFQRDFFFKNPHAFGLFDIRDRSRLLEFYYAMKAWGYMIDLKTNGSEQDLERLILALRLSRKNNFVELDDGDDLQGLSEDIYNYYSRCHHVMGIMEDTGSLCCKMSAIAHVLRFTGAHSILKNLHKTSQVIPAGMMTSPALWEEVIKKKMFTNIKTNSPLNTEMLLAADPLQIAILAMHIKAGHLDHRRQIEDGSWAIALRTPISLTYPPVGETLKGKRLDRNNLIDVIDDNIGAALSSMAIPYYLLNPNGKAFVELEFNQSQNFHRDKMDGNIPLDCSAHKHLLDEKRLSAYTTKCQETKGKIPSLEHQQPPSWENRKGESLSGLTNIRGFCPPYGSGDFVNFIPNKKKLKEDDTVRRTMEKAEGQSNMEMTMAIRNILLGKADSQGLLQLAEDKRKLAKEVKTKLDAEKYLTLLAAEEEEIFFETLVQDICDEPDKIKEFLEGPPPMIHWKRAEYFKKMDLVMVKALLTQATNEGAESMTTDVNKLTRTDELRKSTPYHDYFGTDRFFQSSGTKIQKALEHHFEELNFQLPLGRHELEQALEIGFGNFDLDALEIGFGNFDLDVHLEEIKSARKKLDAQFMAISLFVAQIKPGYKNNEDIHVLIVKILTLMQSKMKEFEDYMNFDETEVSDQSTIKKFLALEL
eukprot:GHVL01014399.1.p1 GENE.GHVL01014399.1~~GHVL01014399.1.p1  ORF type:complete len:758 (+),score=93.33 GHVL01014399.1:354-2627(+)